MVAKMICFASVASVESLTSSSKAVTFAQLKHRGTDQQLQPRTAVEAEISLYMFQQSVQ